MISRRSSLQLLSAGALFRPTLAMATPAAVTVYEARRIITMEPSLPAARFVAVADGIILGLGNSLAELAPWTAGRTVTIDRQFASKVLMPGLIDPHVHPMQAAVMLNLPFIAPDDWQLPTGNFPGSRTPQAWRSRFVELLSQSTERPFICWGYHELFHGPLDRTALDQLAPDRPVVVWQRSFHEIVVNTAALKAWGLDQREAFAAALAAVKADPAHAELDRGLLSETALAVGLAKLRPVIFAPERIRRGIGLMQQMMAAKGVTTVSDMATGIFAGFDAEAAMIRAAFERPGAASRAMLMPIAGQVPADIDPGQWFDGMREKYASAHVRLDRRVKFFADGAFFAQNMRMASPGYTDGHIGKWLTEPSDLDAQFQRFWNAGFNFHIHVNGDEGLEVVLDGLAALPLRRDQTITLEHLGYSTEAQNRRIARMGLMVSAQPNYIRVLGDVYATHGLGADRAALMNRLGSLEAKGVPIGLHSDFNMAPIDPFYLAWIAANRLTLDGNLKASEERLSLAKALRAITIEAAQVIGMDDRVGSVAPGKLADFAVLDQDPFKAGAMGLRDINVQHVIFEGRVQNP
jgi:predicted amidohydrolase YtcJ